MIRLVPMTNDEFAAFLERNNAAYAADKVRSGAWSADDALERARAEHSRLLPEGVATPDHYLFTVQEQDTGANAGTLWLARDPWAPVPAGFIYDLYIEEDFRRRGYAREAMQAIEAKARELGFGALSLHVFGRNYAALALYQELGYEITDINMTKGL